MSTRGAYGFRIHQTDKVTYNHCDSYPTELGIAVLTFIRNTPIKKLKIIAEKIALIQKNDIPTHEQKEKYKKYADLSVAEQSLDDWYCLLKKSQGNLGAYKDGLIHMIDSIEFLFDSLFCEWAYIINLDTNNLEVYRGFNKDPTSSGRYASKSHDDKAYYGVSLILEIPLIDIGKMSKAKIFKLCEKIESDNDQ